MFKKSVFTEAQLDAIKAIATEAAVAAVREVLTAQMPKAAKPQTVDADKQAEREAMSKIAKAQKSKKSQMPKVETPKAEFVLNGKTVEATGYLPYAVYSYNRNAAENLGGKVGKTDNGYFKADFTSVKKAQEFAKIAAYDIPDDAYESIRVATANKRAVAKATKAAKSADNKALAAEMRKAGLDVNSDTWAYAKANGVAKTVKKFSK